MSNREHAARLASRTQEQLEAANQAAALSHEVVNRLLHASIDELIPQDYKGDVVADETIIDLAKAGNGLGTRPEKNRGAASCAEYYVRDKRGLPKRTGSTAARRIVLVDNAAACPSAPVRPSTSEKQRSESV